MGLDFQEVVPWARFKFCRVDAISEQSKQISKKSKQISEKTKQISEESLQISEYSRQIGKRERPSTGQKGKGKGPREKREKGKAPDTLFHPV